jgi:transcriptional regulator with XRE-family HTH domain
MEPKKINKKNTELQREHFTIIGSRLRELRLSSNITIADLEEELELPSGTVFNLELGKGGSTISFIAIVTYYFNKGYSYKWILNYDNDIDFKKDNDQVFLEMDKSVILELTNELKSTTDKLFKTLGKYT